MEFAPILAWLSSLHPLVPVALAALGGLVVLGQAYVAITPTQDDDKWFAKLESIPLVGTVLLAIKSFAPIQRKEK
jgi:amino acid permease